MKSPSRRIRVSLDPHHYYLLLGLARECGYEPGREATLLLELGIHEACRRLRALYSPKEACEPDPQHLVDDPPTRPERPVSN
jgi:hypothetical protein